MYSSFYRSKNILLLNQSFRHSILFERNVHKIYFSRFRHPVYYCLLFQLFQIYISLLLLNFSTYPQFSYLSPRIFLTIFFTSFQYRRHILSRIYSRYNPMCNGIHCNVRFPHIYTDLLFLSNKYIIS